MARSSTTGRTRRTANRPVSTTERPSPISLIINGMQDSSRMVISLRTIIENTWFVVARNRRV